MGVISATSTKTFADKSLISLKTFADKKGVLQMSHITKIKTNEERRISTLKKMCEIASQVGKSWNFQEGVKSFRSYFNTPENNCDHVIDVGANYQIGVRELNDGNCDLMWDNYSSGGLTNEIGQEGEVLNQLYSAAATASTVEDNYNMFNPNISLEKLSDGWYQHTITLC